MKHAELQEDKDRSLNLGAVTAEDAIKSKKSDTFLRFILKEKTAKQTDNILEKEPFDTIFTSPATSNRAGKLTNNPGLIAAPSPSVPIPEQKLPTSKIIVSSTFDLPALHQVFQQVADGLGFKVIESEARSATAVCRPGFSLWKLLCCCKRTSIQDCITAVKMTVTEGGVHEVNLRTISGDQSLGQRFVMRLTEELETTRPAGKSAHGDGTSYNNIHTDREEESREIEVPYVSESSSYYLFHKVLTSDKTILGKNINEYIEAFPRQYKSVSESALLLPQPLEAIINVLNDTVHAFSQQKNLDSLGIKEVMSFCRVSVEKYVFEKLYARLFEMYVVKGEAEDKAFAAKRLLIQPLKGRKLMRMLEFREKFLVLSEEEEKLGKMGFDASIESFNKIETSNTPTEKLSNLMQMYAQMKAAVVDFSKGKYELQSLDDQLPILIYIVAMSSLLHPAAEMCFLSDYLKCQEMAFEKEQLVVTSLQASVEYLIKDSRSGIVVQDP